MMNYLKYLAKIGMLAIVMAGSSVSAKDYSKGFHFSKLNQSLCEATQNNRPFKVRYLLREEKQHIRNIYTDVNCDGKTLLETAYLYQADRVAKYLTKKTRGLARNESAIVAANP